ncbi:MAG: radical SAM protein [Deltaproteobacteria bacterium]|nr:radical SAM protein [Deltaproteobacteria bacterium]
MKLFKNSQQCITAVVADQTGNIFELDGYAAVGMSGQSFFPMTADMVTNMPYGGEMMFLPDRIPVLYNIGADRIETLSENPNLPGKRIYPVAAFNSPGYVISYVVAYAEKKSAEHLPLFSYGAVGWQRGKFMSAVIQVDTERRQDLRLMKQKKIIAGIHKMKKVMPQNRLRAHLENCALQYGCPAGKNFFLKRFEAPLPTARSCNAGCLGCLSLQDKTNISNSQERIDFTPSPEEISEVALTHIKHVKCSVVSFGQGCEGEPLLAANVIAPAIRMIRSRTHNGTINVNTNGSSPEIIGKLFDAGLDSVRISMNSVRKDCYTAYFRPNGYTFEDVIKSIELAIARNKFISINYLNCPGFTDSPEEVEVLMEFLKRYPVNMIQWRNLNFDPIRYYDVMNSIAEHGMPIGMDTLISDIKRSFPSLKHGYFNPPKESFKHLNLE